MPRAEYDMEAGTASDLFPRSSLCHCKSLVAFGHHAVPVGLARRRRNPKVGRAARADGTDMCIALRTFAAHSCACAASPDSAPFRSPLRRSDATLLH